MLADISNHNTARSRWAGVTLLLCLAVIALLTSSASISQMGPMPDVARSVIVQGADVARLATAVDAVGGEVTNELAIIQAVSAMLTPSQEARLLSQNVGWRVWQDSVVTSVSASAPETTFSPVAGSETKFDSFDLDKIVSCDGSRDKIDHMILGAEPVAHRHQGYSFAGPASVGALPGTATLHIEFNEEQLAQALVYVFEASTGIWHSRTIETTDSDEQMISATIDLLPMLAEPADFQNLWVKFAGESLVSDEGKTEVDCVKVTIDSQSFIPVSGYEAEISSFDIDRVATDDDSRDNMSDIAQAAKGHPGIYQEYVFAPSFDSNNFPSLIELRFAFKEKDLNDARLSVLQNSTGIWHDFALDTSVSDDAYIAADFDLTEILESPEDLTSVTVRLLVSRPEGGTRRRLTMSTSCSDSCTAISNQWMRRPVLRRLMQPLYGQMAITAPGLGWRSSIPGLRNSKSWSAIALTRKVIWLTVGISFATKIKGPTIRTVMAPWLLPLSVMLPVMTMDASMGLRQTR